MMKRKRLPLELYIANTGDSRAVLGKRNGKAVRYSVDYKPDMLLERERVERSGGLVKVVNNTVRVINPKDSRRTLLAVSRVFGDVSLKDPPLPHSTTIDPVFGFTKSY